MLWPLVTYRAERGMWSAEELGTVYGRQDPNRSIDATYCLFFCGLSTNGAVTTVSAVAALTVTFSDATEFGAGACTSLLGGARSWSEF